MSVFEPATAPPPPGHAEPLPPRIRLRRVLEDRVGTIDELTWYLDQALPRFPGDDEVRVALEELVDHLGRLLAFEPRRVDACACSVWSSPTGARLIVALEDGPGALSRIGRLGPTRDALLGSIAVERQAQLTALCIVASREAPLIEETVKVRRAGDVVRVITLDALLSLGRLAERAVVAHADVVGVLTPAPATADRLVALIAAAAHRGSPRG